jgi:hypothetical protein
MKRTIIKLLVPAYFFMLFFQACKIPPVIPVTGSKLPFPITDIEQRPFKGFLDSIQSEFNNGFGYSNAATSPIEMAFSFHSSAPGNITALGVLLPTAGFTHTVYLWDAENQNLLVKADVPLLSSGKFTYVSLALAGEAVHIPANHEYYIGFVSTANEPNAGTGNNIYIIDGIFCSPNEPPPCLPIVPFTYRSITFDAPYLIWQPTPVPERFPRCPGPDDQAPNVNLEGTLPTGWTDISGICDIGFLPD